MASTGILDDQIINARALDFDDCIGKAPGDTCTVGCKGSKAVSLSTTVGTPMTLYVDKNGKIVLPGLHTTATGTSITLPLMRCCWPSYQPITGPSHSFKLQLQVQL